MGNTKALEVAEYLKIIPDATVRQVQQACGLSSSSLAHRYMLQARGFNLTQKQKLALDSKEIATLRAQLAERDAQLVENNVLIMKLSDKHQEAIGALRGLFNEATSVMNDNRFIEHPECEALSHLKSALNRARNVLAQATRQPAQDKGGE